MIGRLDKAFVEDRKKASQIPSNIYKNYLVITMQRQTFANHYKSSQHRTSPSINVVELNFFWIVRFQLTMKSNRRKLFVTSLQSCAKSIFKIEPSTSFFWIPYNQLNTSGS